MKIKDINIIFSAQMAFPCSNCKDGDCGSHIDEHFNI